jgi:16S rRNA (guanine(527)-N(7))-methyltransferase RsmG
VRNGESSSGAGGSVPRPPQAAVSRETSRDVSDLWRQALGLGVDLDDDRAARLIGFERLLAERAVPLGAVARPDVARIRERHILDSLRAAPLVRGAERVYDLGSGAGLPGIVVAIALPQVRMVLVDRRASRAAFLELAIEELALPNARVFAGPVEEVAARADACLARAFAPLQRSWEAAERVLGPGGRLVYFGGRELGEEGSIDVPAGAVLEAVIRTPVLESAGPLVIMARQ